MIFEKGTDIKKESVTSLSNKLDKVLCSKDFREQTGLELTDIQYKKWLDVIERYVNTKEYKTNPETLHSFRKGMLYGIALVYKVMDSIDENSSDEVKFNFAARKLLFPIMAIEKSVENWMDDTFLENLMKNAKIAKPKKTKKKK